MTIYSVLEPPAARGSATPDPGGFVFVKEGICWPALYIAAIWFLWRRMWLVLGLYLVAAVAILWLVDKVAPVGWLIVLLFGFIVALEANNLRRWTLERNGYRLVGVASGDSKSEAEFRFFSGWAPDARRTQGVPSPLAASPRSGTDEVVGLFPTPGGGP